MSILLLRELDAKNPKDETLLHLFQRSREHVQQVSTYFHTPSHVAVTTQNGFVQLIDTSSGSFRLFLTHLQTLIPLDTSLRCFSLVPSLFAATQHHYLLYSLSYSNELLLANFETGHVEVLATFTTRPSTVSCDGDYLTCGEGCGQVSVWRASTATGQPRSLWRRAVLEDTVTQLLVQDAFVICCAADFTCSVVSVESGAAVARLVHEPDQVAAVLPLDAHALALCLPSRISVYAREKDSSGSGGGYTWAYTGGLPLDTLLACATCHGAYMAAGTVSGVVVLLECAAATGQVQELVRFDVGYAVVALQLYDDNTLLVVTSAGDLWKWPLEELLASSPAGGGEAAAGDEEEEEIGHAMGAPPQPTLPTQPNSYIDDSYQREEASYHSHGADEEGRDREEEYKEDEELQEQPETASTAYTTDEEDEIVGDSRAAALYDDNSAALTVPAMMDPHLPHERESDTQLEQKDDARERSSTSVAKDAADQQRGSGSRASSPPLSDTSSAPEDEAGQTDGSEEPDIVEVVESEVALPNPREAEALRTIEKELGPARPIAGLRRGPRMDPHKIIAVLSESAANDGQLALPAPVEPQSTQLLLEQRAALQGTAFDYDAYKAAHPLEVEALPYEHPVRMPVYSLQDRVYEAVPKVCDTEVKRITGGVVSQQLMEEVAAGVPPQKLDDLADVTYPKFVRQKDPALEEERQRGGPDIFQHACDDLIYMVPDPSATVLFNEYQLKPSSTHAVLLPMPLPPTPSVF